MTQGVILSMLFYLLIAVTTIYMAYKVQCSRQSGNVILTRTYYWGIFMILFLCSAFRFNVGNDTVNTHRPHTKPVLEAM